MNLQRISFRSFIVFALLAALVVTAGVLIYWRQINVLLEKDVKVHIADAGKEAATDFDRLIQGDREVLSVTALSLENDYPWKDNAVLEETLAHYDSNERFNLLGLVLTNGKVFYSDPGIKLPKEMLNTILENTRAEGFYTGLTSQGDEDSSSSFIVQALDLDPNDNKRPVGAIFSLQKQGYYKDILALSSMGRNGHAFIIDRGGNVILSYEKLPYQNIFDFLKSVHFDSPTTLADLRTQIGTGETVLIGFREWHFGHLFYQLVPLETNGWYLVSSVPATYVEDQASQLTRISFILFGAIVVVFYFLIFFILRLRDVSNRRLFTTAFVDPLTGADNFNRMGEQFDSRLSALDHKAALLIVDINKFKVINDLNGYERGNEVLKRVAQVLREQIAERESFCRLSADRFILLLAYTDRKTFTKRVKELGTQLRRNCSLEGSCVMLDVSFGIYEITEDIPFYIMLDRAHLALEQAKASSVENYRFYEEADRSRVVAERQIEAAMEDALANHEFEVYLQPKCDFGTGELRGAEALVRWNRGEDRIVRPDEFIPLFERNGFILKLDMFIFEETARLISLWREKGLQTVPLAVNFSRLHLNDVDFIPQLRRLAAKYNVPHEMMEVELTESIIFHNLERAQEVMSGLHLYGFSVAMDDFGSGYSSLNVLKNLHFDSIKLDKEFLSDFEENPFAKKVIEETVKMIKKLGINTIAEGVETREQSDFLRGIGCDLAQGYFFSRPVRAVTFEQLLKKQK